MSSPSDTPTCTDADHRDALLPRQELTEEERERQLYESAAEGLAAVVLAYLTDMPAKAALDLLFQLRAFEAAGWRLGVGLDELLNRALPDGYDTCVPELPAFRHQALKRAR